MGYVMENLKKWIWPLEGSNFSQEHNRNTADGIGILIVDKSS